LAIVIFASFSPFTAIELAREVAILASFSASALPMLSSFLAEAMLTSLSF